MARTRKDTVVKAEAEKAPRASKAEKALEAEKVKVQSEEKDHQATDVVNPNDSVPEAEKDAPEKAVEHGETPAQVSAYGDESTKVTDVGVADPDPQG